MNGTMSNVSKISMNRLSTRLKTALEQTLIPDSRKKHALHPSSASVTLSSVTKGKKVAGSCLRQQYYRLKGEHVSNKTPADVILSSMIGDYITLMVQNFIDTSGFQSRLQRVVSEHSFYIEEMNLGGRCDFILYDSIDKEMIGIEVKSVGEYKGNKCLEKPAEEHVLQSLIYLEYYQTKRPELGIKKWYILYISRTENYSIKGRKHGSPLAMMWDYYITMDPNDKSAIVHANSTIEKWADFNIDNIYNRFRTLEAHIKEDTIPPRDYNLQYSEDIIADMYTKKELTRKLDIEKVEKWLKKGAPEGKLKIELGDSECFYCPYKAICWPGLVNEDKPETANILALLGDEEKSNDQVSEKWF